MEGQRWTHSERQGADHEDDSDERQQHQVVHLLLPLSEPGQAQLLPPPRRPDRAAPHHLAPVHLAQADDDRAVAHEHRQDEQRHEGRVGQREGPHQAGVVVMCGVHVDEAPRPGAVLPELAVAGVRQEAEDQRKEVNEEKGEFGEAAADVDGVKVRVADGQAALHGHGAQDERGRQAEETHGEAEEVAQAVTAQTDQGHVAGVADEHGRAEEAGAQQVGERQAGHQDAEDGRPGAMLLLVHPEDEEGQQVPHHAGQEHDDARYRLAFPVDGGSFVAGDVEARLTRELAVVHGEAAEERCACSEGGWWGAPGQQTQTLTSWHHRLEAETAGMYGETHQPRADSERHSSTFPFLRLAQSLEISLWKKRWHNHKLSAETSHCNINNSPSAEAFSSHTLC